MSEDAEEKQAPSLTESSTGSSDDVATMDDLVPPITEIVDRSGDPEAETKATVLKDEGNQELAKGRFLQAITLYSEGLEYQPRNAVLRSNRALAYIKVENYGLALLDADIAIECDPAYAKGYYRRASANFALRHFKLARKDFRAVCKRNPKSKDARARLAEVEKVIREDAFAKAIEADETVPLAATFDPSTISVGAGYEGPHPTGILLTDMDKEIAAFEPGNLSRDFVLAACEAFKDQKSIHRRYVARILLSAHKYFSSLPSLLAVDVPKVAPSHHPDAAPRMTVCGDTHGQYYDVLNIFEVNGWPDATNPYVFNGDFVDRGSFSVEVILTYLMWKLHDPNCIYLSRGNHETRNMTRIYGFEGEVKAKYDDKIYKLFLEVFGWLPLAVVINQKVFVTHGGLPVDPGVTINDIRNIQRGAEPPEKGLMSDLLWSDPQPFQGKAPSKRGVGFAFGPDITENFLDMNDLSLLVRSHEVKEEGYLVEHGGKTITIFSAPNYCDTMGNKGAFIHFEEDLEPKFTQYEAVPHPDIKPMAYAAGMGNLFA